MPKINRKLTETEIKNAKPKEKAYKLYDTDGLQLLVRVTGNKVWQYPYALDGRRNIFTIGKYGTEKGKVGSAEARKRRDEIKALVGRGIDPNQHKREQIEQTIITGGQVQ